ncbi:4-carboxymuconolactone decarboxylase-like protein, partial [Aulographum hederae CBS 113979]
MRLPYIDKDPKFASSEDQAIVERVKTRRSGRGLLELDRTLLHAPPVADGWNSFLGAIRTSISLPTSIREAAICRVAALNQASYEWKHHAPLLINADDTPISKEFVDYVLTCKPHQHTHAGYPEALVAVLAYTDAMTLNVKVPDEVFERLKKTFGEKEIVEITATVAAYNCVSRFLVALDVGEMADQD